MRKPEHCELCEREVETVTRHHLIPRTRHKNKRNKKNFDRSEVHERVIWICGPCHRNIHDVLTEKELEYEYNTKEKLTAHPGVARFTEWIKKRPDQSVRFRSWRERKRKQSVEVRK